MVGYEIGCGGRGKVRDFAVVKSLRLQGDLEAPSKHSFAGFPHSDPNPQSKINKDKINKVKIYVINMDCDK